MAGPGRFRYSLSSEFAFSSFRLFGDADLDESTFCADSTTVNRLDDGATLSRVREEYIRVQAVVRPDDVARVAPELQRLAGAAAVIKWRLPSVSCALTAGVSGDLDQLRARLEQIAVVVVDPMAPAREMDRRFMDAGVPGPAWTLMLNAGMPKDASVASTVEQVKRFTAVRVLHDSGVGELESLVRRATADNIGVHAPPLLSQTFAEEIGFSHRKAAKLAVQSTALLVHEEIQRKGRGEHPAERWQEEDGRFLADDFANYRARRRIEGIAAARLAFDKGEEATGAVARLRDTAELFVAPGSGYPDAQRGVVQAVDDTTSIRIQVADVVAGYASWIIAREGLLGLVKRFELVLINNAKLTEADAGRWDRDRAWHRRVLAQFAA